jgi:ABC-type branched-subunit amino acid transport system permease subunit
MKKYIQRGLLVGFLGGFMSLLFGGWTAAMLAVVGGLLTGFMSGTEGNEKQQDLKGLAVTGLVGGILMAVGGLIYDLWLSNAAGLKTHPNEVAYLSAVLAVVLCPVTAVLMGRAQQIRDKKRVRLVNVIVLLTFLFLFPYIEEATDSAWLASLIFAEIYVLLALGLNIVVGFAGLLDLGYAAFFAIGAYTTGLMSSPLHGIHVNFWILIWLSAVVAGFFGILLGTPTLRLRGDYLAIVTLGFGEIVPVAFSQLIKITLKEPITCYFIPLLSRLTGGQPVAQCLVLVDNFDLTAGVKGISPLDRPVLPIITPVDEGLSLVIKLAVMAILVGLVAFLFMRSRRTGKQSKWAMLGYGVALAAIIIAFVPLPQPAAVTNPDPITATVTTVLHTVQPGPFISDNPVSWYFLMLALLGLSLLIIFRLRDSRLGRTWTAIREDELAANQMGVNLRNTKLLAFAMGATFSGFAGAFYGAYYNGIFPSVFEFSASVIILSAVVLGGIGNVAGVILGALIIMVMDGLVLKQLQAVLNGLQTNVLLPAVGDNFAAKQFIQANFDPVKYRFLMLGLVLVVTMALRPEGLLPSREQRSELHRAEETGETPDQLEPEPMPTPM